MTAALVAENEKLKKVLQIAGDTIAQIEEWLGHASTRNAAEDSIYRLRRALEESGIKVWPREPLLWRGSLLKECNDAGFFFAFADERMHFDPTAPAGKRIFGNAEGPTLAEFVAEFLRMKEKLGETAQDPIATGREHRLKAWPAYFEAVRIGTKPFEARKNDRNFQVGDVLVLEEWDPRTKQYTGLSAQRVISYILAGGAFGVEPGWAILGLRELQVAARVLAQEAPRG